MTNLRSEDLPDPEYVCKAIIRRLFNDGKYWERAKVGEFNQIVHRETHRYPPPAGEPRCCLSQYVRYLTPDGKFVAGVHQYLRPDGTLGRSGRPDPKQLIHEGRYLVVP